VSFENLIGNTPLVKLSDKIYAKLETYNPTGSIKDRMASYILQKAEESGAMRAGYTIVEASSGNTGIAFAMLAAQRGYGCLIVMPRNMTEERKQMMKAFGARIIEVGDSDFKGAIKTRDELVNNFGTYWSPRQFSNPYNIECHAKTTALEIHQELVKLGSVKLAALISGAGTGGTIMGCQQTLSKVYHNAKFVLMMPAEDAATHGIQGINDGADFLVNREVIDDTIAIKTEDAKNRAKLIAKEHGLLVGISSGANVLAAERWVEKNEPRDIVVTFLCDRGERYLSCD
jgi:cysteine synthase A